MNETDLTQVRYNRIAPLYDLMEILPERRYASWREALWAQVPAGHILEVGVGTGKNIPYYPPAAEITAIDLAPGMLARAQRRAKALGQTFLACNIARKVFDLQSLSVSPPGDARERRPPDRHVGVAPKSLTQSRQDAKIFWIHASFGAKTWFSLRLCGLALKI